MKEMLPIRPLTLGDYAALEAELHAAVAVFSAPVRLDDSAEAAALLQAVMPLLCQATGRTREEIGTLADTELAGLLTAMLEAQARPFPAVVIDRLAAAYGWLPEVILALTPLEAEALQACAETRRRRELADLALTIYAGAAGAQDGPKGYRALVRWVEEMRAPVPAEATPLHEAGIILE